MARDNWSETFEGYVTSDAKQYLKQQISGILYQTS